MIGKLTEPFDLERFLTAQEQTHATALAELGMGRKQSHWMWFIFPQIDGLGHSPTARRYAIKSIDEARAYLDHPVLGPRLLECCQALLDVDGKSAAEIFGHPDDMKLRSSMTLFAAVSKQGNSIFNRVLEKYYGGVADGSTIELLGSTFTGP